MIPLLLALEFLIAADIILTVIHPTFEDIAILASIVAIRTVISYFLEKEIAALAVFLASDESSFITGTVNPIDGGMAK